MARANHFPRLLVTVAALLWAGLLLPAGCPLGSTGSTDGGDTSTDATTDPNTADPNTADTSTTDTDGTDGEAADDEDATDADSFAGPEGTGALLVETLPGALNAYFDIYDADDNESVRSYQAAGTPVYLPAGVYDLTAYFTPSFLYGDDVTVSAGATTTVTLGAVQLLTLAGAPDGEFDIYDPNGQTRYSSYNQPNALITAPPGTFVLKEYFNADFTYAADVEVTAGEVTSVQMGGIMLVTVEGAADGEYAIWDSTGQTRYASYELPDVIVTAPPGTYTLKEYFNPDFTYATDVEVAAGELTRVIMGAIRYNGTLAYDIYADGALVSSYNEPELIITAPPGTYVLTEYFDDENVLATNVVVTAGQITDVP